MQLQVKIKLKQDNQKSLGYLSNLICPNSHLRVIIDGQAQQIANEQIQTIHKLQTDTEAKKKFICTEWNRHQFVLHSFRSPYTNNYFPPSDQKNVYHSPILKQLEEKGNILFRQYARIYYGQIGTISNFYVHQTEEGTNFAFVLLKNYNDQTTKGVWSSTNFCEIRGDLSKNVAYKLTTSVLYDLNMKVSEQSDFVKISGAMKKNVSLRLLQRSESKKPFQQYENEQFHLAMAGMLIEQTETLIRQQLESVFLVKAKELCFKNRYKNSKQDQQIRIKMAKQYVNLRKQSQTIVQ